MTIFVQNLQDDPYANKPDFILKGDNKNVLHNGIKYELVRFYKQQLHLSPLKRIKFGVLALLATITFVPLIFKFKDIKILWKKALNNTEAKTVMIANVVFDQKKPVPVALCITSTPGILKKNEAATNPNGKTPKKVHFGYSRKRLFDTEMPPEGIKNISSFTEVPSYSLPKKTKITNLQPNQAATTNLSEITNVTFDAAIANGSSSGWTLERKDTSNDTPEILSLPAKEDVRLEQERKMPPLSGVDTLVYNPIKKQFDSAHGVTMQFADEDILAKEPITHQQKLTDDLYIYYTKYGKAIIQQQATRGCTAATAAMLIADNGKMPSVSQLKMRNLGNEVHQSEDIRNAGLTPIVTTAKDLEELKKSLKNMGSAIVCTANDVGGHVVIVDDISDDLQQVRIREPYHGWEITLKAKAFLAEWQPQMSIIQVEQQG